MTDVIKSTGKDVYIITSENWTEDMEILAVADTMEEAIKGKDYFENQGERDVEIVKQPVVTFKNMAKAHATTISIELRETEKKNVFTMGKDYRPRWQEVYYENELPPDVEKRVLTVKATISNENKCERFAFLAVTTKELPPNDSKQFREWVRDEINKFNEIVVLVPYSETNPQGEN